VEKLTGEEVEFSKTLSLAPLDTPCFKRFYCGPERLPLTIQTIACGGEIFGISARVYDPTKPQDDSNSLFLIPLNHFEMKLKVVAKRKRTGFAIEDYGLKFGLIELLKSKGFNTLFKKLLGGQTSNPVIKSSALTTTFVSKVGTLESYLTLSDILA
jgi:hypothetical protein